MSEIHKLSDSELSVESKQFIKKFQKLKQSDYDKIRQKVSQKAVSVKLSDDKIVIKSL